MFEYGSQWLGFGDDGNKLETAVAAWAFQGIDVVDSFEKSGPFEAGQTYGRRSEKSS
jgi:hypothetical protein